MTHTQLISVRWLRRRANGGLLMQRDRRDYLSIRRTVGPEGWCLRRAHMAHGMIGLAGVVILTAMLPSPAGALQVQQLCWSLNPFVDTLLVAGLKGEVDF